MSAAANTKGCFIEFRGQRLVGVLFNAMPRRRKDLSIGNKTLIFEDGRGLTISAHGSYWIETAEDVRLALRDESIGLDSEPGGHP